jgi:hypothetical protein
MRNKLLRIFAILFALAAVALTIGLYGTTNRSKTDGRNGAISLEAPPFISVAEAAETGIMAFPADKAGISAYVKLPTIDIDKVRTIFTQVEDVGENYIIGIVQFPIRQPNGWQNTTEVRLYADMDGWFVAYFTKEEPAAKIMKWPENYDYHSPITKITTTMLREVLSNAGQAAGVGIPLGIKYYDFRFPEANTMTLFVKGSPGRGQLITQVKIPTDWTLYEASFLFYGYTTGEYLKVDEAQITGYGSSKPSGSYKGAITVGVLHTIEINDGIVATVLIYKTD